MKVLLANSTCKVGGVSMFMLSMQSALRSQNHACELFFFERGTMERFLPTGGGVHFGDLADCLRLVERGGFDVVHANNVDWTTGISAVRELGAKLILTAHKARASAWTYGWNTSNCDALATVSNWIRLELQPFTDAPIQVVPNGIDVQKFSRAPRAPTSPPIVAWIGRGGSPLKGLEKLATIAPALHRGGVRLWIIDQHGPEMAAAAYPEAAAALQPLAEVWGGVPFDAMPDLYRDVAASGGCILSTSVREGLPLALLEAQACGCSVVASDVQGNNECVSEANGGILYAADEDGAAVAARILSVLGDRPALQGRQDASAAYVREHFSLTRMATRYLRIYAESPYAASGHRSRRVRARLRLSPLWHYRAYLDQRWGVGDRQYGASQALARSGDWRLAAGAVRSAVQTSPTIFANPRRLAYLVRTLVRAPRPPVRTSVGHPPSQPG